MDEADIEIVLKLSSISLTRTDVNDVVLDHYTIYNFPEDKKISCWHFKNKTVKLELRSGDILVKKIWTTKFDHKKELYSLYQIL